MNEKEKLINRLKILFRAEKEKKDQIRAEKNIDPEIGFLVKESFVIASLIPEIQQFNITFDDLKED